MTTAPFRIALVGFGNIGTGVVDHFQRHGALIDERAGRPMVLSTICDRDLDTDRGVPVDGYKMTSDFREVLADPGIDAVIELVGGTTIAHEVAKGALEAGKHVATANKALVATYGGDLLRAGAARNAHLLFEASVMAGVPVIRAMNQGLQPAAFKSMAGILNGTCNYILTELAATPDAAYDEVLAEAQRLGYAEQDPTLDVEGVDAAHKIAIMGSLLFGMDLRIAHVAVCGVSGLDGRDLAFAERNGMALKLLATASRDASGAPSLAVWPTLIPRTELLAQVDGVLNALWLDADPIGPTFYVGAGAGKGSTSTGIISDLVNLASLGGGPHLGYNPVSDAYMAAAPVDPAPAQHPERLVRIIGPDGAERLRDARLRLVCDEPGYAAAVAPAQTAREREAMLAKLGLGKGGGGGDQSPLIVELRWAVLDPDAPPPFRAGG